MKPSYIQMYPTLRCTQSCTFCFNGRMAYHGGDMTYDNALRLIDIALANDISSIDIMGGEPFLLGWMPKFISAALRRGIAINISTNGSLPDAMNSLRHLSGQALQVGVSLEGASALTHAALTGSCNFDLALDSIRLLRSFGIETVVKTVVCRANSGELRGIAELMRGVGVHHYYVIHMDDLGSNSNQSYSYPEFMKIHRQLVASCRGVEIGKVHASCFDREGLGEIRCAGGSRKLFVMPDGSVYPCNLLVMDGFRLGNIFNDPYETISASDVLGPLKTFMGNHCEDLDCGNRENCTGGCPAHLYARGLSINAGDPRCMPIRT